MRQSLRLGRVAGIPVGAHWTVAVILLIIAEMLAASVLPAGSAHLPVAVYWVVGAATAVVFAGSLLAHELAHAIVARRNGVRVRSITLWMLGGVAELDGDPPSAGADLRIALAGPAASLAMAAVTAGVAAAIGYGGGPSVAASAAAWLALMNGLLAVFNMLPGAPLDGGRVLRAVLWRRYGDRGRAGIAAARAGRVLGAGIALVGAADALAWNDLSGLWLVLIGLFLVSAAAAERTAIVAATALAGLRVSDVMTPDPEIAAAWATVGDFIANVAARSRQSVFPVVGLDGALAGVVFSDALARVPADDRSTLRLDRLMLGVPPPNRAAPGDPASSLLTRPPLRAELTAVVLDHGQVVGLVTTADIQTAVRQASLRPQSANGRPAGHDVGRAGEATAAR